ncbi:MAG: acyltransferase [Nitrospirae bacterium]|nr:MAG: acyltransferase [Nitrospirota bacterium]
MNLKQLAQRFLVPQPIISLYYMVRFRCIISLKAEIELSPMITLGPGVTISSFTKIKATNGPLSVEAHTGFGASCYISTQAGGISIGENCLFGPHVNIMSANYDVSQIEQPFYLQGSISRGVRIGNNVWVGAGSTILDGTVLGDNTVVVANSLVNRRYPPNVMLQGNPAKIILRRSTGSPYGTERRVCTRGNGHS